MVRSGGVSAPEKHQALWAEARPPQLLKVESSQAVPRTLWILPGRGPWGTPRASGVPASCPWPLCRPLWLNQDDISPATGPRPCQWCQRKGTGKTETWDTDHTPHTAQHLQQAPEPLDKPCGAFPWETADWDPHPCQPTQLPGALFSMHNWVQSPNEPTCGFQEQTPGVCPGSPKAHGTTVAAAGAARGWVTELKGPGLLRTEAAPAAARLQWVAWKTRRGAHTERTREGS